MTELVLKGKIDQKKLDAIVLFLKSWDIEVEVKTVSKKKKGETKDHLFTDTFGMWANRDIDIKEIRKKSRERRTKTYGNDSL